ncbi:MAG: DUF4405 domain-containing protein [Ruminococcaceae bacterium]|nr:DUF4405 domain-containing protein [Oscillospiraceae bacterium]
MKAKQIIKIAADISMTVILLLLTAYSLVGEAAHEWLGIAVFVLFVLHHILNVKWSKSIFKGKYTPFRILQTVLAVLALISMLGSMISGIVLSRYALAFLKISGGQSWARNIHMLSAYWGFCIISLHVGIHWNIMLNMAKRLVKKPSAAGNRILRVVGALIAGYGVYAFIKRDIGNYMLLKFHFVFFDFEEPLILFLLDYLAVMGLFVFVGHYLSVILKRIGKKDSPNTILKKEQQ